MVLPGFEVVRLIEVKTSPESVFHLTNNLPLLYMSSCFRLYVLEDINIYFRLVVYTNEL